jgi:hypothetical protein
MGWAGYGLVIHDHVLDGNGLAMVCFGLAIGWARPALSRAGHKLGRSCVGGDPSGLSMCWTCYGLDMGWAGHMLGQLWGWPIIGWACSVSAYSVHVLGCSRVGQELRVGLEGNGLGMGWAARMGTNWT